MVRIVPGVGEVNQVQVAIERRSADFAGTMMALVAVSKGALLCARSSSSRIDSCASCARP